MSEMRNWRAGSFDKDRVQGAFHVFTPAHAENSLQEIDLGELWEQGKRLILLDVDNTLVTWKAYDFAPEVVEWVERAKGLGFDLCIISNTNRLDRLAKLSELLGVETVRGRFKPSRAMFRLALMKFKRKPEEAIMVGDQLMTDIFGANRAGIEAIWVRKMEGKEFGPTSINRFIERLLTSAIYKGLVAPADEQPDAPEVEAAKAPSDRTLVHQIVKFCIVGGTSFAIDAALTVLLIALAGEPLGRWMLSTFPNVWFVHGTPAEAAFPVLKTIAALFAMFNSFVWNRRWTFEVRGKEERLAQLRRFYIVAILGFVLNLGISSVLFRSLPGSEKMRAFLATAIAAVVVAAWNFTGQRLYAFRKR